MLQRGWTPDHAAAIDRARSEVVQRAKELKAFNEASKVGLETYLEAVTALDYAETMGFEAVKERLKRARDGDSDVMDVYEKDFNKLEVERPCDVKW